MQSDFIVSVPHEPAQKSESSYLLPWLLVVVHVETRDLIEVELGVCAENILQIAEVLPVQIFVGFWQQPIGWMFNQVALHTLDLIFLILANSLQEIIRSECEKSVEGHGVVGVESVLLKRD